MSPAPAADAAAVDRSRGNRAAAVAPTPGARTSTRLAASPPRRTPSRARRPRAGAALDAQPPAALRRRASLRATRPRHGPLRPSAFSLRSPYDLRAHGFTAQIAQDRRRRAPPRRSRSAPAAPRAIDVAKTSPYRTGAELFATHCSGCHTLSLVGAEGSATSVQGRLRPTARTSTSAGRAPPACSTRSRTAASRARSCPQNIVVGRRHASRELRRPLRRPRSALPGRRRRRTRRSGRSGLEPLPVSAHRLDEDGVTATPELRCSTSG